MGWLGTPYKVFRALGQATLKQQPDLPPLAINRICLSPPLKERNAGWPGWRHRGRLGRKRSPRRLRIA